MDFREIKEFLKDISSYLIVIIIVIIIFVYVVSIQQVVGPSMNNTLNEGDIVTVSKLSYKFGDIKRGDIVVFEYDEYKNFIKRVVGLPGETIEYKQNTLYVNGKEITENYIDDQVTDNFSSLTLGSNVIPKNKYLVLGDNRENSEDSRVFGFIDKKDIIGKVSFRIWPINKMKHM